jgi:hypothetical protein
MSDGLRKFTIGVIIAWGIIAFLSLQGCKQPQEINPFESLSEDAYLFITGQSSGSFGWNLISTQ